MIEHALNDGDKNAIEGVTAMMTAGQFAQASALLISRLNETHGIANKAVWHQLLLVYRSTDQKVLFEKLAGFFTHQFGSPPDTWETFA